jgi:hypothetical protein
MGSHRTDFLFATPSFIGGAGSVLNLGGQYFEYNRSATPAKADERALQSDWGMTGQDIRIAMQREALHALKGRG